MAALRKLDERRACRFVIVLQIKAVFIFGVVSRRKCTLQTWHLTNDFRSGSLGGRNDGTASGTLQNSLAHNKKPTK